MKDKSLLFNVYASRLVNKKAAGAVIILAEHDDGSVSTHEFGGDEGVERLRGMVAGGEATSKKTKKGGNNG